MVNLNRINMKTQVWIKNIEFNDSSIVELLPSQITVFVGGNNTGKSLALKQLHHLSRQKSTSNAVITNITLEKEGSVENLIEFIEEQSIKDGIRNTYKGYKYNINGAQIAQYWQQQHLPNLHEVFVNLLTTEERLKIANPPQNIKLSTDAPQHPIHFLQRDEKIEKSISRYFKQAFNEELIVHRNAGNQVPLHMGKRPIPKEGEDRISLSYIEELEKLPLVHTQGDGMRSFVGLLLSVFVSNQKILLVDEPEAFLHPPQARLLGKMLAKDLPTDKQLFLATHSSDFLKGLLDANVSNLKIIRIQRNGNINNISELDNDGIKAVWNDSLLRHSNILDGLFHSKVIVCESDSDCRFYSAILQSLYEEDTNISPDVLFIHCGGKHRVGSVLKALKKLDVDISAVLDFDILNNINPIKEIFEEFGGNWDTIKSDWKQVKEAIDAKRPELETADLKKELIPIIKDTEERIFPKEKIKKISSLLKKASAWSHAKQVGKNFVPSGNPMQAYQRLIASLESVGFFVVEVGELESFVKSIGNHGPKWVNGVLAKDLVNDYEFREAKEFVRKLIP